MFQVGDKVKCIEEVDVWESGTLGEVYELQKINNGRWLYGRSVNGSKITGCSSNRFELVKDIVMLPVIQQQVEPREFQVGDRVRCSESDEWSRQGWEGTVTTIQGGGELNTRVKWDEGFHFWIRQKNLELIAEVPEIPVVEEVYIYLAWIESARGNKFSHSSHKEDSFNTHLRTQELSGAKVLAKKRIKITL